MKTRACVGGLLAVIALVAQPCFGDAVIAYETLNSAGTAWASNGNVRLGGTVGQMGWIGVGTGGVVAVQSGFWKMEDGCEMYPVDIRRMEKETNAVSITFDVMRSNRYTVVYLPLEGGGVPAGTHVWTNLAAGPFTSDGGMGSTTTLVVDVSSATNAGRFFLIRCESP